MNYSRILATGACSFALCRIEWTVYNPDGAISISSKVLVGGIRAGEILLLDSPRHTIRSCIYVKGGTFDGPSRYRNSENLYLVLGTSNCYRVDHVVKGTWYE